MTTVIATVIAFAVGWVVSRMLWISMRASWSSSTLMRENYQGVRVPTAAGIIITMALIAVEALRMIAGALGFADPPGLTGFRAAALIAVLGFSSLGMIDDLVGSGEHKGLRGHLGALKNGELTSGGIKLFGGLATALIAAGLLGHDGFGVLLLDATIIALFANFLNLLDTRPGRAGKMGAFLAVVLIFAAWSDNALVPLAIVTGAAIGLLRDDLRERLMLGDTGANALGAVVGLGFVASCSLTTRLVLFALLLGANVLSEYVSFSRIIDRFPPFRMLDQLGRRRPPIIDVRERERTTVADVTTPSDYVNDEAFSDETFAPRDETRSGVSAMSTSRDREAYDDEFDDLASFSSTGSYSERRTADVDHDRDWLRSRDNVSTDRASRSKHDGYFDFE